MKEEIKLLRQLVKSRKEYLEYYIKNSATDELIEVYEKDIRILLRIISILKEVNES